MKDVKGKVAFITGAASGMGLGMARAFVDAGMKVMLSDIDAERLDKEVAALQAAGGDVAGVALDVTDRDAVFAAKDATLEKFGKVHVACANAGVGVTGALDKCDQKNWEWCIDVCLWGPIYCLQAFVPVIKQQQEGGHFLATSSMAGMASFRGMGPYNVAKFGVVTLIETLNEELKKYPDINASVLCPGAVATNIYDSTMHRQDRYGGASLGRDRERMAAALGVGLDPDVVGKQVLEAIIDAQPYIFTDPSMRRYIDERHRRLSAGYDWADNCKALRDAGATS